MTSENSLFAELDVIDLAYLLTFLSRAIDETALALSHPVLYREHGHPENGRRLFDDEIQSIRAMLEELRDVRHEVWSEEYRLRTGVEPV